MFRAMKPAGKLLRTRARIGVKEFERRIAQDRRLRAEQQRRRWEAAQAVMVFIRVVTTWGIW